MVSPIFDVLSPDDRREVLLHARRRTFKAREIVFHEGDPGDSLHVIETGLVAISGATPNGDIATFAILGTGATFGEVTLTSGSERSASVRTMAPTRTLSLQKSDVEVLRRSIPAVDRVIAEALATTVRRLSAHLLEAFYVPANKRALRRLLELADWFGGPEPGITIPFTQDDFAGLVGATRQTVNKVIRDCEDAGMIVLGRGKVTLVDPAQIKRKSR